MTSMSSISAKAVADSVGINTHIDFNKYGYQNLAVTIAAVKYLGITHIRDCPGNEAGDLSGPRAWSVVASACNALFLPFIGETSPSNGQLQLDSYAAFAALGLIEGVEGPNEWDNLYPVNLGTSVALAATFQQKVFAVGQTLKLPVVNISFGSGWTSANNWAGNYDKVGDLSAYCDFGNVHTYPNLGQSVEAAVKRLDGLAKMAASSRQVIHTEFGFNSSQGFPQADMARFDVFAILDAQLLGCFRLYYYALFDDGSGLFGLMNQDGSPKLSGTAVRNFLALIQDTAPGKGESLDVTLTGTTANDRSLLMQKSDGTFLLALWNEKDAAHTVTMALTTAASVVNVYDPVMSQTALQTFTSATQVVINVPNRPVLVSIGAGPPVVLAQIPTGVTINPATFTLDDATPDGVTAALVNVATNDGAPFTGALAATGPCALSGSILTVKGPLTTGPSTMTSNVTATGGGVSVTGTLTLNITPANPPPLAVQTPTGMTLAPAATTLLDTVAPGTLVSLVNVATSDGLPYTGPLTVDAPFKIIGQNVVVDTPLTGPTTLVVVVKASENGVDQVASLSVAVTHVVVPVPPVTPVLVANPVWGPPALQLAGVGKTISVGGLAINDQWAVGHVGAGTLNIDVVKGTASLNGADGKPLAGSGTNRLRLQLNLANANAALMTLTYTAPATACTDKLTLTYYDQGGVSKAVSVGITVS